MDEATWNVSPNPFQMLNFLQTSGWGSDRKLRLLSCAFCRAVEHLLTDECYRSALEVAERYADGEADVSELRQAHAVVMQASNRTEEYDWSADKQGMLQAANALGWATESREPLDPPAHLAGLTALGAKNAALTCPLTEAEVHAAQCALIRDILGPLPFRSVAFALPVAGDNRTVRRLAQSIYDERAFHEMPILGDALEDAGCADAGILAHCRAAGDHVRGCWVIDLLLGKS
jgi:hypothetical protein